LIDGVSLVASSDVCFFLFLAVAIEKTLCKADGSRSWYQSDISIWQNNIHENKHEQEGI
jgi:hypothetical protein